MDFQNARPERVRSALFVDFDNMFISLKNQDETFARVFGENQESWLGWLENELGNPRLGYRPKDDGKDKPPAEGEGGFSRKILVRRCYLNPKSFADFRPYFIKSGFEVVDCPQLTAQGKTSTDIHLVIDVLDTLYRSAQFDEFIILSGDADFTPLLLRLRMHDRRTVILSAGHASPAYKAACDHVIPTDTFISDALGIESREDDAAEPIHPGEIDAQNEALLQRMADRVFEEADDPAGIQASDLPGIYSRFPEFKQSSHWLGFRTLRRLTEQIVARREDLTIVEEDPWCVARVDANDTLAVPDAEGENDACEIDEDIRESIAGHVRKIVDGAKGVITLSTLANEIKSTFAGHLEGSEWFGAGDFKNFLRRLDLGGLKLSPIVPGYLYDPKRGDPSRMPFSMMGRGKKSRRDLFTEKHPHIAQLAWKIHQFTDVPYLMPEHYNLLFQEIAREVNERGYQLTRTSKTVRDRCVEKGAPVSRANVNDILIGLRNAGPRLTRGSVKPEKLAQIIHDRVLSLCKIAQLELKPEEARRVAEWITGRELPPESN